MNNGGPALHRPKTCLCVAQRHAMSVAQEHGCLQRGDHRIACALQQTQQGLVSVTAVKTGQPDHLPACCIVANDGLNINSQMANMRSELNLKVHRQVM
jgi:hypothetical protein